MAKYITITKAAQLAGITKQTMFAATRKHVLQYKVIEGIRYTTKEWLNEYLSNRFNRQRVYYNGAPLFDFLKGEWSVKMTAAYLQCTIQHVHFLLRTGRIKSFRRGSYHVVFKDSVTQMLSELQEKIA